jgi:hypothetical protein
MLTPAVLVICWLHVAYRPQRVGGKRLIGDRLLAAGSMSYLAATSYMHIRLNLSDHAWWG